MKITEKLRSYQDKINSYTAVNQELKNLIAIELFDYIHDKPLLNKEFTRRYKYFELLAQDKEFSDIQDRLFEAVNKILRLTNVQAVEELQKEFNNTVANYLRTKPEERQKDTNALSLLELYTLLQDKEHYYRVGNCYITWSNEVSDLCLTQDIRAQHGLIEQFFNLLEGSIFNKTEELQKQYETAHGEYGKLWYAFDEKCYREPFKLHVKKFEEFFLYCTELYLREGYEALYKVNEGMRVKNTTIDKVKNFCNVVIEDLVEYARGQEELPAPQLAGGVFEPQYNMPASEMPSEAQLTNELLQKYLPKLASQLRGSDSILDEGRKNGSIKLSFYPDDGIAEYRTATATFKSGTKSGELLRYMTTAKKTPLSVSEIQESCNKNIDVETHRFKTEKDVSDTIAYIRKQLKVKKSEFFPVRKKEKSFIWIEK